MSKPFIKIGNRIVGDGNPTFIIGEIGINHNGDMHIAKQLIDVAHMSKLDAVKFQLRHMEEVYTKKVLDDPNHKEHGFKYLVPHLDDCELSSEDFKELKTYAESKGIEFLCTPFDPKSIEELEKLNVSAYKVASADMTNFILLKKLAKTGKPLIVSTGMSTMDEIEQTVYFLKLLKCQFMLLHCNSNYPAPFENLNLSTIQYMKDKFNVPIGYSSHELGITAPSIAVAHGASLIEKHITLNRTMEGPDHVASLEPQDVYQLVKKIRYSEKVMGTPRQDLDRGETLNRQVLGKSLVAAIKISKGTIITEEMLSAKSPGQYLSVQEIQKIIGTPAKRDFEPDDAFTEEDLPGDLTKIDEKIPDFSTEWGFKGRFDSINPIVSKYHPKLFEFHFNDGDLNNDTQPGQTFPNTQLVIHAPEYNNKELIDLCSLNKKQRERSIEIIQKTIDKAIALHPKFSLKAPPKIVIHVGGYSPEPITDESILQRMYKNGIESFQQLNAKGAILLPENLPPKPWFFGGQYHQSLFAQPEDLCNFCKDLSLKMCLDLSHASLYCKHMHRSMDEFVKMTKPFATHLHIADAKDDTKEGLQINDGEVNFNQAFDILGKEFFQQATWVPEVWNGHLHNNKGFVESLKRLGQFNQLTGN